MTPILLLQLRNIITSPLISIFCKKFEENEILLRKSIDTSICTVLIGLENIMDNTILYDKIIDSITFTEFYKTIEFENGKVSSINYSFEQEGLIPLNMIFSNKKGRISEMISNEVGIKSETAGAILNFAVMLILSHFVNERQKSIIIQNDLNSQKKVILNNVPEGIRVLLGYSNFEYEDAYADSNTVIKTDSKTHFLNKIFKF
ncbi:hypothetical protein [Flavobacterium granuli]|uniref:Endonuclease III-like uncharacterized protein n=1 Tax=Flavobacterium granuli TaxID=280093 RepID=A0ABU1S930_9FLAO|nr:hypothetical protein [Flavobacterium granuli]MDR6846785.1 endonuclease III-like uncharacterized protein [Flavobacterium granuli]